MSNEFENNNISKTTVQNDKLPENESIKKLLSEMCEKVNEQELLDLISSSKDIGKNTIVEISNKTDKFEVNSKKIKYSDSRNISFIDFLKPQSSAGIIIYIAIPIFILSKVLMIKAVQSFFYFCAIKTETFFKGLGIKIAFLCKSTIFPAFAKLTLTSVMPYLIATSWLVSLALLIFLLCKLSNSNNAIKPVIDNDKKNGELPLLKNFATTKIDLTRPNQNRQRRKLHAP